MSQDTQTRNLSHCTQSSHLCRVTLFAHHFGESPDRLGPEQIGDYWVFLAIQKQLAPGSTGIAVSPLCFLHGVTLCRDWDIPDVLPIPRQPRKLSVVPSLEEVGQFLGGVASTKQISPTVPFSPAGSLIPPLLTSGAPSRGNSSTLLATPAVLPTLRIGEISFPRSPVCGVVVRDGDGLPRADNAA